MCPGNPLRQAQNELIVFSVLCSRAAIPGENGAFDKEDSPICQNMKALFNPETGKIALPPSIPLGGYDADALTQMFLSVGKPYMEGPFMTKHGGKYYLQ